MEGSYYKGIDENFLKSNRKEFIRDYDVQLVNFIESRRIKNVRWGGEDLDSVETEEDLDMNEAEKDFIILCISYLSERNHLLLEKWENEELYQKEVEPAVYQKIFENWDLNDLDPDKMTPEEHKRLLETNKYRRILKESESSEWSEINEYNYKIHFLHVQSNRLGFLADWRNGIKLNKSAPEENEVEPLSAKGRQKLIYLNELGILDFLRDKNSEMPPSKIASILATITGETYTALQSPLNAILTERGGDAPSNNNPYSTKKALKIREDLERLGFEIRDPLY